MLKGYGFRGNCSVSTLIWVHSMWHNLRSFSAIVSAHNTMSRTLSGDMPSTGMYSRERPFEIWVPKLILPLYQAIYIVVLGKYTNRKSMKSTLKL